MHAPYVVVLDRGLNAPDALERTVLPAEDLDEARRLLGEIIAGSSPFSAAHGRRQDVVGVKEDHVILITKGRFGGIKEMTRARIEAAAVTDVQLDVVSGGRRDLPADRFGATSELVHEIAGPAAGILPARELALQTETAPLVS